MSADWLFGLGAVTLFVAVWLAARAARRAFPRAFRIVDTAVWIFDALWIAGLAAAVIYRLASSS